MFVFIFKWNVSNFSLVSSKLMLTIKLFLIMVVRDYLNVSTHKNSARINCSDLNSVTSEHAKTYWSPFFPSWNNYYCTIYCTEPLILILAKKPKFIFREIIYVNTSMHLHLKLSSSKLKTSKCVESVSISHRCRENFQQNCCNLPCKTTGSMWAM